MRKFWVVFIAVIALSGCKKEEVKGCKEDPTQEGCNGDSTTLSLNFRSYFYGNALQKGIAIKDNNNTNWKFEGLNFYISEIKLVQTNDTLVEIEDFNYLDLLSTTQNKLSLSNVPKGAYKGIKFNVGLTSEQNEVEPSNLPLTDARLLGLFWGWMKYVFVRYEGRIDENNDNSFSKVFLYHTGTDDLFRTVELSKTFSINDGDNTLSVKLDAEKVFNLSPGLDVNIYEESVTHSDIKNTANYPTAVKFSDNFSKAFTLE